MASRIYRVVLLCFPFAVFACAGGSDEAPQSGDQDITSGGRKEGESCGGVAGLRCASGLDCQMSGPTHPDQSGVCTRLVTCQAVPRCADGKVQVDQCDAADKDCSPLSVCGHTIFCTKPQAQCDAIPACTDGTVQVDKCEGNADCSTVSMCGRSIFCAKE
jgi:hypothetical protein